MEKHVLWIVKIVGPYISRQTMCLKGRGRERKKMSLVIERLSKERATLQIDCLANLYMGNDLCKEK